MPQTPHTERHFTASEIVRDVVIGMSDGLTVPFALAAGLTGGLHSTANPNAIIVTAGLAEIAAAQLRWASAVISLRRGDAEHYARNANARNAKCGNTSRGNARMPKFFQEYGLTIEETWPIVEKHCAGSRRSGSIS